MPKYKIIEAGKIVNIVLADADEAAARGWVPAADGEIIFQPERSVKETAIEKLEQIDREAGMTRVLRETLIAIAGAKAPAYLLTLEAKAAAERDKLK